MAVSGCTQTYIQNKWQTSYYTKTITEMSNYIIDNWKPINGIK